MKKELIRLIIFPNRTWVVAEVWKGNNKIADINLFYNVDDQWIYIYDTIGGQGTGYQKGNLIEKIFIGDCEFVTNKEH